MDYRAEKQLAAYIEGDDLPESVATRLRAVLDLRARLGTVDAEIDELRQKLVDIGTRADEIRASLTALGKTPKAGALRRRLVKSLSETTTATEAVTRDLAARSAARAELRVRLTEAIHELSFDRTGKRK